MLPLFKGDVTKKCTFSFVSHADFEFGFHVSRHEFSLLSNTKWTLTKQSQLGQLVFSRRSIATFGCCLVVLVLQEALPRGPRPGWPRGAHHVIVASSLFAFSPDSQVTTPCVVGYIPDTGVRIGNRLDLTSGTCETTLYLLRCSLLLTPVFMDGGVTCLPTCPLNIDLLM